ncbi:MAG TPA: hypothetical protein VFV34_03925 [Blastocatellia bacterium]|nr:hypothetical protein [Blastocatellia bacterium]
MVLLRAQVETAPSSGHGHILLALLIVLLAAKLMAELFERLKQPAVVGEIQVGVGMMPRGEVGIVVAQIGLGMKVVGEAVYAVVLAMTVATTLIAPMLIRKAFAGERQAHTPATSQK